HRGTGPLVRRVPQGEGQEMRIRVHPGQALLAAAGLLMLALCVSPGSAWAPNLPQLVRCQDMQGDPWEFDNTQNGHQYVQQSGTAYLTFASGVSCAFARDWAQTMSVTDKNIKHGVFTDAPRGWKCKQHPSDIFREQAMNLPLVGFDVGPANCGRFVGKGRNRRGIGFSWAPLPLSYQPN